MRLIQRARELIQHSTEIQRQLQEVLGLARDGRVKTFVKHEREHVRKKPCN